MTPDSNCSSSVLIVDAGHGVGLHLTSLLAARGFDVIAWSPGGAEPAGLDPEIPVRWVHDDAADGLDPALVASAGAAIFNTPALDEARLVAGGGLADAIADDAAFFMRALQVVSRAMIERGCGQIWALAGDDSFAYYLPLPVSPIAQHLRVGAIRAIAKELRRFGASANAAVLQPIPEMVEATAWQQARAGVGSYAQKYRPVPLGPIADTLAFWLGCKTLPMNGSVVHFGNGVYDGNI